MPENEAKRVRRTPQQLAEAADEQIGKLEAAISDYEARKQAAVNEYDKRIDAANAKINALKEKKAAILAPKPARKTRKPRMTKKRKLEAILKQAQKAGKTPEEIAEALGVDLGE